MPNNILTIETPESPGTRPKNELSILAIVHDNAEPAPGFIHGLRLTCAAQGQLEVVDLRKNHHHHSGPGIRSTLERWDMLPPGSSRADVGKLGIAVKKSIQQGNSHKLLDKDLKQAYDLLVIGISRHGLLGSIFGADLNDYLARSYRQTTLYVPDDCRPFVDFQTGTLSLNRIVVPVSDECRPDLAFSWINRLITFFPDLDPTIIGIHLGDSFPAIDPAVTGGLPIATRAVPRDNESVAAQLAQIADSELADLIVMTTKGRETLIQKIMGSTTEQVLRKAPCPVLAVALPA